MARNDGRNGDVFQSRSAQRALKRLRTESGRREQSADGSEGTLNDLHERLVSEVESDLLGEPLTSGETWARLPPAGKVEDLHERVAVLESVLTRVRRAVDRDDAPDALGFVAELQPDALDAMSETVASVESSLTATEANMDSDTRGSASPDRANAARFGAGGRRGRDGPATLADTSDVGDASARDLARVDRTEAFPTAGPDGSGNITAAVPATRSGGWEPPTVRSAEAARVRDDVQSWARSLAAWVRTCRETPPDPSVTGERSHGGRALTTAGQRRSRSPRSPW